jgi:hypothetical protein
VLTGSDAEDIIRQLLPVIDNEAMFSGKDGGDQSV